MKRADIHVINRQSATHEFKKRLNIDAWVTITADDGDNSGQLN